jgi:hypothetical protein
MLSMSTATKKNPPVELQENKTGKMNAAEMLKEYNLNQHKGHNKREETHNELRRLLAVRSAHLPGYSWCGDWIQWMRNNHPLFGMCCKYRDNPISMGQRVVILAGSISFGLAATNFIYLFYNIYDDANGIILTLETGDGTEGDSSFELTYEMVALWTVGSLLHSLIDLGVWHLAACSCCLPGGCLGWCGWLRTLGRYITITLCAFFIAVATSAVIMRANFEEGSLTEENSSFNELAELDVKVGSFSFLYGYLIELSLVYCVYYPIMATIFFSGAIRPCLPCVGGRPKEIERQSMEKQKLEHKKEESFEDNPSCSV